MTLIYIILGLGLLVYVGLPLVIKSTLKINARPGTQPLRAELMPEDVQEYFNASAVKLAGLGFEKTACFLMEQAVANVTPHVTLWVNRRTNQAATVNVIVTTGGDKPPQIKRYVEFLTKLADEDRAILTNNSPDLGAFAKTAASDTLCATRLQDVAHLYKLHQWRERQLGGDEPEGRFLPQPGRELDWFAQAYEESIRRQVGTRYLMATHESGIYRPTMHGAYMMTWAELPPLKQARRSAEDKRAETQIRHAAATVQATQAPPLRKVA